MSYRRFDSLLSVLAMSWSLLVPACEDKPAEPTSRAPSQPPRPAPVTQADAPSSDPAGGSFTLEQATKGLEGSGGLAATIRTDQGTLECELFADKAPTSVANFVGLARGLRPYKLKGQWVTQPAYDGTTFHRVVDGFMIQGGDPSGTGAGDPGYTIDDEIWPGSKHDEQGLLCMANRGKNTNGMQFFITDGPAPHLDGGYTIFGKCGPESVLDALSSVPTRGDRAIDPPVIQSVTVSRK